MLGHRIIGTDSAQMHAAREDNLPRRCYTKVTEALDPKKYTCERNLIQILYCDLVGMYRATTNMVHWLNGRNAKSWP